jgi:hypothetical protein
MHPKLTDCCTLPSQCDASIREALAPLVAMLGVEEDALSPRSIPVVITPSLFL